MTPASDPSPAASNDRAAPSGPAAGASTVDPPSADTPSTDRVFAALSDATRRELLREVVTDGPTTATLLAADRPISRQAVAKHLSVLGQAGLVIAEKQGRETRSRADVTPLSEATDGIEQTGSAWDRRLERLTALLGD